MRKIETLSKEVILKFFSHEIDDYYKRFSDQVQEDEEINEYVRCIDHKIQYKPGTDICGWLRPLRKHCFTCINEKK